VLYPRDECTKKPSELPRKRGLARWGYKGKSQ
jgi:hypothetical protein